MYQTVQQFNKFFGLDHLLIYFDFFREYIKQIYPIKNANIWMAVSIKSGNILRFVDKNKDNFLNALRMRQEKHKFLYTFSRRYQG